MRDEGARLAPGVLTAFAVGLLCAGFPHALGAQEPTPSHAPTTATAPAAPASAVSAPSCFDCHAGHAGGGSPHGRAHAARNPKAPADAYCATCHGDGKAHVESGGDVTLIASMKGAKGSETCATCHATSAKGASHAFRSGVHANSDALHCQTCHSIHKADAKAGKLLVKEPNALCETCHLEAAASFRAQPYRHRLGRAGLTCVSCHQPHGRTGRESLRLSRSGELPCLSCHASQRGPHVFDHVSGAAGDCQTCHAPHGSPNAHQLVRNTEAALCLECHSPGGGTLGSQPPSSHDLLTARWRSCTVCHTAVHGSNRSPQLLK